MYHSVDFGSKNSYLDWHLVPDSRPIINMPSVVTKYVDIPGMSGKLDMSELLTGYPTYTTRTGDLKFHVLNDYVEWQVLYQEIANYLHGKKITISLEDDSDYYYEGRVSIDKWESNNDGTWSDISFKYELDPYKYYKTLIQKTKAKNTAGLTINMNNTSISRMPEVPTFQISNIGTDGIDITLTNDELGINELVYNVTTNGTHTFPDLILSNINGSNTGSLTIVGTGTVIITYRKGSL